MPLASIAWSEVRRLDLNAAEHGIATWTLMQRAGRALADAVALELRGAKAGASAQVLVLAGKGNNGADGLVAARLLHERGLAVEVLLAEAPGRAAARGAGPGLPARALAEAQAAGVPCASWRGRLPRGHALVVDALLGVGARGEPRAPYDAILRALSRLRAGAPHAARRPVLVACDVPSGLGTQAAVPADATVTFHARKHGMDDATCGRIRVAPIGIPAACAREAGLGDLDVAFRRPRADSHKGQNGRVLVVGGSIPLVGAPHYAALGAYRTGADLVHVLAPAQAAAVLRGYGPHAIVHDAPGTRTLAGVDEEALGHLLGACDAAVVGPGLGTHDASRQAAAVLLDRLAARAIPTVVDADALDAFDPQRHRGPFVLTPHAREFEDLAGRAATPANVRRYAHEHGVVVLRKGPTDVIAAPGVARTCARGHPTMTVGGTGDVLTGVVAALLAKGASPFEAACGASYANKVAGEVAARTWGWGATAAEVADAVPSVLMQLDR